MKMVIFLIFIELICIFSTKDLHDDQQFQDFIEYTKKYEKHYPTPEELEKRFEIWKKNLLSIKRNNPSKAGIEAKVKSIGPIFKMNEFGDLTQEEFASKYLTFNIGNTRDLVKIDPDDLELDDVDPPEDFDWTEQGITTTIKHQKDCGGCWAFATAAAMESQYLMEYGQNISLSEQQLIDCDETNNKCTGGNMKKSFTYLQSHGLMLNEDYPFINGEGECCYEEDKTYVKVKNWSFVPKDEEQMKKALYKYGPLAGAINGWLIGFYSEGIYEPWFSIFCPALVNHAVVIVGYGVEKATGKKFWRVKNSWGPEWGEGGYFRILRGEGVCGIDQYTLVVEIEKTKY